MDPKERRGGILLVLGALVMLGTSGAITCWVLHRDRRTNLTVFHWIPRPGPLRILGGPPWTSNKGDNYTGALDPRLLDHLRAMGIGGELRLVADIYVPKECSEGSHALLLQTLPTGPIPLNLKKRGVAVYFEDPPGSLLSPEEAQASGIRMVLTPDKPLKLFNFSISGPVVNTSGGVALATWW